MRKGYIVTWISEGKRWFYEKKTSTDCMQSADVLTLNEAVMKIKQFSPYSDATIWRVEEKFSWVVVDD